MEPLMKNKTAIAYTFLFGAMMCLAEAAEPKNHILRGTNPQRSIQQTVSGRLCFAGRYQVKSRTDHDSWSEMDIKLLEPISSDPDHPNSQSRAGKLESQKGEVELKVGGIYCLIITEGSMTGLTIVAWAEDSADAMTEMKQIMQAPEAYQNSEQWKKRRLLWKGFGKNVGFKEKVVLYCENEKLNKILCVINDRDRPQLCLYDDHEGTTERVVHQKVISGVNQITCENGVFIVWYYGQTELFIGSH